MKNIVSNSIFFIFISFVLLFLIIFFNTSSSNNYLEVINYILYENKGLFVFFSQFIFVILNRKLTNREIIVNTILCWLVYLSLNFFFTDSNLFTITKSAETYLFIDRDISSNDFSLLNFVFIKSIFNDIGNWDLVDNIVSSSFILLLINGALISYVNEISKNNIILNVFVFICLFFILLYFWNPTFNIFIFLLSIILLKIRNTRG